MSLRNVGGPYRDEFARGRKPANNEIDRVISEGPNAQLHRMRREQLNATKTPTITTIDRDGGIPPATNESFDRDERPEDGESATELATLLEDESTKIPKDMTKDEVVRMLEIYSKPLIGWLARKWPALRRRLIANPRLPLQMGVELTVGFVTKTLAEVQGRGERFWKELDFYFSDIMLELVGDAMLVWLLSPVAMAGMSKGWMAKLPTHMLQVGNFSAPQRAMGFAMKGLQFGMVGFASSMVGHSITQGLISLRDQGEEDKEGKHLAPVLPTSLCWGGFMMTSSNLRYQLVNGFEQRVLDKFVGGGVVGAATTFAVRFGNCFLGGVQWLPWARFWGIQ